MDGVQGKPRGGAGSESWRQIRNFFKIQTIFDGEAVGTFALTNFEDKSIAQQSRDDSFNCALA